MAGSVSLSLQGVPYYDYHSYSGQTGMALSGSLRAHPKGLLRQPDGTVPALVAVYDGHDTDLCRHKDGCLGRWRSHCLTSLQDSGLTDGELS